MGDVPTRRLLFVGGERSSGGCSCGYRHVSTAITTGHKYVVYRVCMQYQSNMYGCGGCDTMQWIHKSVVACIANAGLPGRELANDGCGKNRAAVVLVGSSDPDEAPAAPVTLCGRPRFFGATSIVQNAPSTDRPANRWAGVSVWMQYTQEVCMMAK